MDKTMWLLVIDDHREATQYKLCDSKDAVKMLFEKVVRENYFDPETSSDEQLMDEVKSDYGGWETDEDDYITFYELPILTAEDVLWQ